MTIRHDGPRGALLISAPPALHSGRAAKLTSQLFPDGAVVPRSTALCSASQTQPRHNAEGADSAGGHSFRTKVLGGPVVLCRGMDMTIDW